MGRIEIIGSVNKGRAELFLPAEHPLPDILRKNRIRVKRIFWQEITDVSIDSLKDASIKLADALPEDLGKFKKTWEDLPGAPKWHRLIIHGRDCRPRLKNWILLLIVPPPFEFDTGPHRIAFLQNSRDARTFSLIGQIIPQPVAKSSVGWDEYAEIKHKEFGDAWTDDQEKFFRRDWKERYGSKPHRWYGIWYPRYLRPHELSEVTGLRFALASTVLDSNKNAINAAKAEALEQAIKAKDTRITEQSHQLQDAQLAISKLSGDLDDATLELEIKGTPPLIPQPPKAPAFVMNQLNPETVKKKPPEPGQYKNFMFFLIFVVGIGAFFAGPYGIVAGTVLLVVAFVMFYLDYVRDTNKKEKQKQKDEAPKAGMTEEAKAVLGKASDKLAGSA